MKWSKLKVHVPLCFVMVLLTVLYRWFSSIILTLSVWCWHSRLHNYQKNYTQSLMFKKAFELWNACEYLLWLQHSSLSRVGLMCRGSRLVNTGSGLLLSSLWCEGQVSPWRVTRVWFMSDIRHASPIGPMLCDTIKGSFNIKQRWMPVCFLARHTSIHSLRPLIYAFGCGVIGPSCTKTGNRPSWMCWEHRRSGLTQTP